MSTSLKTVFTLYSQTIVLQGIKYFEQVIKENAKKNTSKDVPVATDTGSEKDSGVDPGIYCQLGHLLLLLEQYPKGNIDFVTIASGVFDHLRFSIG